MKTITALCVILVFDIFGWSSVVFATDQPDQKALSADLRHLDALEHVFYETQARGDQFGPAFWHQSKQLAERRGPVIIEAVMIRSRRWKGEEGLVYVPLVALLPRSKALEILHRYQRSKRELDRVWASEFITEFDMSDTKSAVAHYSAEK